MSAQKPLFCFSDGVHEFYKFYEGLSQFLQIVVFSYDFCFFRLLQNIISVISKLVCKPWGQTLSMCEDAWIGKPFYLHFMTLNCEKFHGIEQPKNEIF